MRRIFADDIALLSAEFTSKFMSNFICYLAHTLQSVAVRIRRSTYCECHGKENL